MSGRVLQYSKRESSKEVLNIFKARRRVVEAKSLERFVVQDSTNTSSKVLLGPYFGNQAYENPPESLLVGILYSGTTTRK